MFRWNNQNLVIYNTYWDTSENHKKVSNLNFHILFHVFVYRNFSPTFTDWDFIPLKSWENFLYDSIKSQTVIICSRLADFRAYFYPTKSVLVFYDFSVDSTNNTLQYFEMFRILFRNVSCLLQVIVKYLVAGGLKTSSEKKQFICLFR